MHPDLEKQQPANTSNWKYRQYMQQNAKTIMKNNSMNYIQDSGNNPYALNQQPINTTNSDLKQSYINKEQMQSRMIAPSFSIPNPLR